MRIVLVSGSSATVRAKRISYISLGPVPFFGRPGFLFAIRVSVSRPFSYDEYTGGTGTGVRRIAGSRFGLIAGCAGSYRLGSSYGSAS